MKYRIVELKYELYTSYLIQKRVFGFWINDTRPTSEVSFGDRVYYSLEDARDWISRQSPQADKILSTRIVE